MGTQAAGAPDESTAQLHPGSEEVVGYRDGDLAADRMARVEKHFAACAPCRERLMAAQTILARVDLLAERLPGDESLESELLLERLRRAYAARMDARETGREIPSLKHSLAARVARMAKHKRKGGGPEAAAGGSTAAYALWGAGDFKSARALAQELLAASPPDSEREKLNRLLLDTAPDPRALQIGVFCVTVAVLVVLLTKLFG